MKLAAISFWREMPIVVTFLLLATAYFATAKDIVLRSRDKDSRNHRHVDDTENKFPPRFKNPSKMFNIDMKPAGSSIRLKCAAEGNPTPNITWYKNKMTPIQRTYLQPSYGKWSMIIEELTKADDGNYTCVVCNELDCIEHTVALHIQQRLYAKPVLIQGVVNQTLVVGEAARFSCEFFSDMHLYVYWMFFTKDEYLYKDMTDPIDSTTQETIIYLDKGKIVKTENPNDKPEQLTIYNVTREDEGWYVCIALNSLGNTTAKGYLTVHELTPTFKTEASLKTYTASSSMPMNNDNTTIPANVPECKRITKMNDESNQVMTTLKQMFVEFSKEQDRRFQEIRHSIEVMSAKYDDVYSKINCMEKERLDDKKTIKNLEENIEVLERNSRLAGIGIRNVPGAQGEKNHTYIKIKFRMFGHKQM